MERFRVSGESFWREGTDGRVWRESWLCRLLLLVVMMLLVEFDDDVELPGISEELVVSEGNKSLGVGVRLMVLGSGMVESLVLLVHVEVEQVARHVRTLMPAW